MCVDRAGRRDGHRPRRRALPPGPAQPGRRRPSPAAHRRWSLLLQPTGKVDAWLRVHPVAATRTYVLDVDAGFGDGRRGPAPPVPAAHQGRDRRAGRRAVTVLRLPPRVVLGAEAELAGERTGSSRRSGRRPRRAGSRRDGSSTSRRRRRRTSRGAAAGRLAGDLRAVPDRPRGAGDGRRAHRRHHPGRGRPVADRRLGQLHQGLLHRPGAGRPHRQPGQQRAPPGAPPGDRRRVRCP